MSKKIYILQRTDAIGYDEYDAKIVRANSAPSARKIACRARVAMEQYGSTPRM